MIRNTLNDFQRMQLHRAIEQHKTVIETFYTFDSATAFLQAKLPFKISNNNVSHACHQQGIYLRSSTKKPDYATKADLAQIVEKIEQLRAEVFKKNMPIALVAS